MEVEQETLKWISNNNKIIKEEPLDEIEYQQTPTEIDIGPIKLEDNVCNYIKIETSDLPLVEQAAKETKPRNRREAVRIFHQRIVKLELNNSRKKAGSHASAEQKLPQKEQNNSHKTAASTNAEHMRELRQRLMRLENPIKSSRNFRTTNTSSQLKKQLEQRLLKVDLVHRTKRKPSNKQREILPSRTPPKTSAQRMRELRQRRRELQSKTINVPTNQSTNIRPQTPPELSVQRMREFRKRLLDLDESMQNTRVKQNRSIGNSKN